MTDLTPAPGKGIEREIIQPISEKPHAVGSGIQKLYRFDNGYGASVVQFSIGALGGSYGAESGLWELAVLRYDGDGDGYELTYETPITDDVMGHLSDDDVQDVLVRIRELPNPSVVRVASTVGVAAKAIASAEESGR